MKRIHKTFICVMTLILLLGCLQTGVILAGAVSGEVAQPGDIDIPIGTTSGTGGSTQPTSCSHSYGDWTKLNSDQHERICKKCLTAVTAAHTWNSGTVTKKATCKEEGIKTYTCTACSAEKTETIAKTTQHTWNSGTVTKKATCKEEGVRTYTCTICGETKTEAIAKLTDHTYDSACDADCNVCGTTRTPVHSYKNTWSSDKNRHWYECTGCGQKKNAATHTAGAAATETAPQTCTVCGYIITPATGHKHSYTDTWTTDFTGHWHACTGCDARESYAAHTYDNACDSDCNVCGTSRNVSHSYSTTWSTNKEGHWYECTVCAQKKDAAAHTPGAAATETVPQTCTVCRYIIDPVIGHAHSFANAWTTNTTGHWHTCPGCSEQDSYAEHVFDNACDTNCNTCGYVRKTSHDYSAQWSMDDRKHWHLCSVCGAKADTQEHTFGNGQDGTRVCAVCEYVLDADPQETTAPDKTHTYDMDTGSHLWFNIAIALVIIAGIAVLLVYWWQQRKKNNE